jgi:hypothetical protein
MENEDVMHNLHWNLVNAVINVHVSVQLSGYRRKTLLKLQHDKINRRDVLSTTISIISLTLKPSTNLNDERNTQKTIEHNNVSDVYWTVHHCDN